MQGGDTYSTKATKAGNVSRKDTAARVMEAEQKRQMMELRRQEIARLAR